MANNLLGGALAVSLLLAGASGAQAVAPAANFELTGDYSDSEGGPSLTGQAGATFSGAGVTAGLDFLRDGGPSLSATLGSVYSIELYFRFNNFNGSSNYNKIIDFQGNDGGLYNRAGHLNFYRAGVGTQAESGNTPFTVGQLAQVVLTRDAGGIVSGYVDGQLALSFNDSVLNIAPGTGTLRFFDDDNITGGLESAAGFADYIRTYDSALTAGEVTALYNQGTPLRFSAAAVPEPATWGQMLAGFGLVGGLARRRRRSGVSLPA